MKDPLRNTTPLPDGTVYSKKRNADSISVTSLKEYSHILNPRKIERLLEVSGRLKDVKIVDINATATGGGVAEMLYSAVPFINELGIENDWKIISGSQEYFECTKSIHNMLQGMEMAFQPDMVKTYCSAMDTYSGSALIDSDTDLVIVHDPQPAALGYHLKKPGQTWVWRCHIDIEEEVLDGNPSLRDFMKNWLEHYDAAIFTAAHYVITQWSLPKFIIPPFIDPLSEKNRELSQEEINKVLERYGIDRRIPIIAQIGRFDPWKGLDRTIAAYRLVRKEKKCQLILAGGFASDDPEGERIFTRICEETKDDSDIHVLNLSLVDRLANWKEVNALQRAADVIIQPSTREGFGLVITEALWKGKPVIADEVGAIPLQIREGDTGFFYRSPREAAQTLSYLLDKPDAAKVIGESGKQYVAEHFLMPDRIADWLMAIDMLINAKLDNQSCANCIISFHPWYKLSKRRSASIFPGCTANQ
ncbi:MAG: glycosyltransferase [Dehalococcoidales bacterium]|nr:glycosyltransferase [Dehalococcoidales bacterium]